MMTEPNFQTRSQLSAEDGIQFKEAVRNYMTREITLNKTMEFLHPLFKKSDQYAKHIEGMISQSLTQNLLPNELIFF